MKIIKKVDRLLFRWNTSNPTPIVEVTTLIVPKSNNLILILPKQKLKYIKSVERTLFKSIWNEKPYKIKRDPLF